jgi:hypothetical protein
MRRWGSQPPFGLGTPGRACPLTFPAPDAILWPMPSGLPTGSRTSALAPPAVGGSAPSTRAGRDWLVIVSKWTLLCAAVFAGISGFTWALGLEAACIPTLTALGVCLVCLVALVVAWSDGGRARLFPRKAPKAKEDPALRLAKRSGVYRTLFALASAAALLTAVVLLFVPGTTHLAVVLKLGLAGGAGLATSLRARAMARSEERHR